MVAGSAKLFFFFKQKTAYELQGDWSSDVCSSDLPWRRLYDPARVSVKAAGDFLAENVTAIKSMAEHLGGPLLPSEDALGPGEGGLVRGGLQQIGRASCRERV